MNKLLFTSAILATALVSSSASAADRSFPYWYLGLSGGVADQTDSDVSGSSNDINWDAGYIASASLGYQPPGLAGFRPEVEYSYRQEGFSGGDVVRVHTVAANLYYDFLTGGQFTPYIGGGLGWANFNLDGNNKPGVPDGSDSQPIYQGMIGIGYEPVSLHNVGLNLQYRYMAPFSDPSTKNLGDYEYDNHSVEVGAKFRF